MNYTLHAPTLVPEINKPFDILAEGLILKDGIPSGTKLELFASKYKACFKAEPDAHIFEFVEVMSQVA